MYCNRTEVYHDDWLILHDPDDLGKKEKWYESGIDNAHKEPRAAFVPGFSHQFYFYEYGIFWYQKRFRTRLAASETDVYMLRIGSADFLCETYINGKFVGLHRGTEDPFEYDVTDYLDPAGENLLVFRVSKPYDKDVDGYSFMEIPHRNERTGVITPGSCQNECGISGKVELAVVPKLRITDMYVTADTRTSLVNVQYTVHSDFDGEYTAALTTDVGDKRTGEHINDSSLSFRVGKGDTAVKTSVKVDDFRRWDISDPFLYYVNAFLNADVRGKKVVHTLNKHTGFRDFVVKPDGYFYLNGKRIFLRCSHTGNCMPFSTHHIAHDPALLRKDFFMAKAAGLNMIRFISGCALPEQLDYADELGIMVYEESVASWLMGDGPRAKELYEADMLNVVRRDRSHPSVCVWGTLNETLPSAPYGDVCRIAREILPALRDLDETRLVLYSSGRFDGDAFTGSVANPYDREWQCLWNREDKNSTVHVDHKPGTPIAFFENVGDVHMYPHYPISKKDAELIRTIGSDVKRPVFMSEYGCGSVLDVIWLTKTFDNLGVPKDLPDVRQIKMMQDNFLRDLYKYGFGEQYAFPGDLLRESQKNHSRQRALGFDLIRSNPYMNGFSITGLLDHSICGEGLFTLMREWKPGVLDAIQNGFAPLKWCIFPSDTNVYAGKPFRINAVLANEDVLHAGDYKVAMKILGDGGVVYSTEKILHPTEEQLALFSVPVFDEEVTLDVPTGTYEIHCDIDSAPAMDSVLKFYITRDDENIADQGITVVQSGLGDAAIGFLERKGVKVIALADVDEREKNLIVIGRDAAEGDDQSANWDKIYRMTENGSRTLVASRQALRGPDGWSQYLRLADKPRNWPEFNHSTDWLYHMEYIARRNHPYFKGMPTGMMDWEYWGRLICGACFCDGATPDDTPAASFGPGCINDRGYNGGFNIGMFRIGKGALILNAFEILKNLNVNPAADKLFINILNEETKKL